MMDYNDFFKNTLRQYINKFVDFDESGDVQLVGNLIQEEIKRYFPMNEIPVEVCDAVIEYQKMQKNCILQTNLIIDLTIKCVEQLDEKHLKNK